MKTKPLYVLFAAVFVIGAVSTQNADDLPIPVETDNQFPPEHSEPDGFIEGSGDGIIEEHAVKVTAQAIAVPKIEHIESPIVPNEPVPDPNTLPCPKPCVCNVEGDSDNYIVDCSGYGLTEFPASIDPKTTTLKLHNNKLTEIPRSVSELKKLKVLNANDNSIMELALGSVSELPELVELKLANNRLIEYPKDLKNSISLTKLQELDLSGNDIRTTLSPEVFQNLKALRSLVLPQSSSELILDLCNSLRETLVTVCTESCKTNSFDCPDAPGNIEEDLINATLPGMIPSPTIVQETNDNSNKKLDNSDPVAVINSVPVSKVPETSSVPKEPIPVNEFSLRNAVNNEPADKVAIQNVNTEGPTDTATAQTDVKVGATTTKQAGGVDKSVIGVIVAGMIIVIAVITIKKNWSSIKNRFSSTPRPNDRSGANANGTTPEEVPLQDKSPA